MGIFYEKELKTPAYTRRRVKRELSLFTERAGTLTAEADHFAPKEGGLAVAEGAVPVETPEGVIGLITTEGHGYATYYRKRNGVMLPGGTFHAIYGVKQILRFHTEEGETVDYAFTGSDAFLLDENTTRFPALRGSCAAVHCDRLFSADGFKVSWSMPLTLSEWEHTERGAGSLELPSDEGNILALVPLGAHLYLFREHGITRLRARGDPLDFRAERVPYPCGTMREKSVRLVGDCVLFCADGLFSFDGTRCKGLHHCGYSEIDPAAIADSACCAGKYYAAVVLRTGERRLWCVSPGEETGYFLRYEATAVAGGRETVFLADGKLYRLTERGLPVSGRRECTVRTEPSCLGLSLRNKFLDAVTVEGEGIFRIAARGEKGLPAAVTGRAGQKLAFPAPVRGTVFSFELRTSDESARIGRLIFDVREEEETW